MRYTYLFLILVLMVGCGVNKSSEESQSLDSQCNESSECTAGSGNFGQVFTPVDFLPPRVSAFPAGGLFGQPVNVTLVASEPATFYYTTDESTPTIGSTLYVTPLSLNAATVLKVMAIDAAGNQSQVRRFEYSFSPGVPTITAANVVTYFPGTFSFLVKQGGSVSIDYQVNANGLVEISLGIGEHGSGQNTVLTTLPYSGGISSQVVNGSALQGGINHLYLTLNDQVGNQGYCRVELLRDDTYALATIDIAGGLYNTGQTVSITSNENSRIYYTTNGVDPTEADTLYSGPILLNTDLTLKYFSVDYAGNSEPVRSQAYIFDAVPPVVTLVQPNPPTALISGALGVTTLDVQFSADQDGTYAIELGGTAMGTGTGLFSGSYPTAASILTETIDQAQVNEGVNTVHVYVRDLAGNIGQQSFTLTKDSQAKTPVVISPGYRSFLAGLPITFTWSDVTGDASEVSGFGSYELQVSNQVDFSAGVTTYAGLATNSQVVNSGLANGRYYWRVRFIDGIGNTSAYSGARPFYLGVVSNDINNDGFSDYALGSAFYDAAHSSIAKNGRVYVFFGAATPLNTPALVIDSASANEELGHSVDILQDFNGDGISDLVIGAPRNSSVNFQGGRVYVFYGGAALDTKCASTYFTCNLNAAQADLVLDGEGPGDNFGWQVKAAGDLNLDGTEDLAVGAIGKDTPAGADSGRLYFFYGGAAPGPGADLSLNGPGFGAQYGYSLTRAGDVNNDGYADVVAGAPFHDATVLGTFYFNTGSLVVNFGRVTGAASQGDALLIGDNSVLFGLAVGAGLDLDKDGFSDLVGGGPQSSKYGSDSGDAALFTGGFTTSQSLRYPDAVMSAVAAQFIFDASASAFYGSAVSMVGDLDNNGNDEFVICGSNDTTNGQAQAGRCYLYTHNGAVTLLQSFGGDAGADNFGNSVASPGDVNGDGFIDFLVAAYRKDIGVNSNVGQVTLFYGAATIPAYGDGSLVRVPGLVINGEGSNDFFGVSISGE